MKSASFFALVSAMFALSVSTPNAVSQDTENLHQKRERIIREFDRIGLNSTPGDAMTLRILIQARNAQRGVEVGSATGYGAIVMGVAFERTGGKLTTLEIDPDMARVCEENIKKMKLEDTVDVVLGDALEVMPKLEGQFDFVFIDALKQDYYKYLKAIEPNLKKGAIVVADNVIRFKDAMQDYLDYVQDGEHYETVIIRASDEKRDGMAISYKLK